MIWPPPSITPEQHQEIQVRAWEIWNRNGRPDNTALADWIAAETEYSKPGPPPGTTPEY